MAFVSLHRKRLIWEVLRGARRDGCIRRLSTFYKQIAESAFGFRVTDYVIILLPPKQWIKSWQPHVFLFIFFFSVMRRNTRNQTQMILPLKRYEIVKRVPFINKEVNRRIVQPTWRLIDRSTGKPAVNPFNPKIKIKILLCRPYSFTIEVVGRSW